MVFVIGIDHSIHQREHALLGNGGMLDLRDILRELVGEHKIQLIAEENSVQAMQRYNIVNTPAQVFAEENEIQYLFSDPDSQERIALGIRSRQDTAVMLGIDIFHATESDRDLINKNHRDADQAREVEWMNRIRPYINSDIIFICGFEHTQSFVELLNSNGLQASLYKILD